MGSLMAGWDSRTEKFRKNNSLTKGEIEAYWRSKKLAEEEHLKAVLSPIETSQDSTTYRRSSSLPARNISQITELTGETDMEKLFEKHGWWTSSNLAFLNEPPVLGR